jgi:hypothetical protein
MDVMVFILFYFADMVGWTLIGFCLFVMIPGRKLTKYENQRKPKLAFFHVLLNCFALAAIDSRNAESPITRIDELM